MYRVVAAVYRRWPVHGWLEPLARFAKKQNGYTCHLPLSIIIRHVEKPPARACML